jgi:hypothetical protein
MRNGREKSKRIVGLLNFLQIAQIALRTNVGSHPDGAALALPVLSHWLQIPLYHFRFFFERRRAILVLMSLRRTSLGETTAKGPMFKQQH